MQNARMIVAFAVFVAAAVGGVYALSHLSGTPDKTAEAAPAPAAAPAASGEGFFYETIGQGAEPAVAEASEAAPAGLAGDEDGAKSSYTLELAVTQSREEAETLIDELRGRGIDAYYTPLSRSGKVVYRVRRGIYPTQREAQRAAVALKGTGAKVIKLQ